jgi:hypothetical protein
MSTPDPAPKVLMMFDAAFLAEVLVAAVVVAVEAVEVVEVVAVTMI